MKINFPIHAARIDAFTGWLVVVLLTGCGWSGRSGDWASGWASGVSVGQTLALSDGTPFGTVGDADGVHRFCDGGGESGVWAGGSPRIPGRRNGMLTRFAARMME